MRSGDHRLWIDLQLLLQVSARLQSRISYHLLKRGLSVAALPLPTEQGSTKARDSAQHNDLGGSQENAQRADASGLVLCRTALLGGVWRER